ncbi:VC0807 family protein [Nonomuraea roseola]|uniref:VC0807 family protein n=1 Tax=Nonomuraea roseola TaxID=46179 RepID=A0ABV5Q4G6_9ACTN
MATVQASIDSGARRVDAGPVRVSFPSARTLTRQVVPRLCEGVVVPLAVFYAGLTLFGLTGALAAVLAWVYGSVAGRLLLRRPISGTMILAMVAITVRSALALWSGSAVVYFLQPELGTICISLVFLASVRLRRPLVGKLILDYVRLPAVIAKHERVRRCFVRLTVLWALVLLVNATLSIWLLLSQSIEVYLLVRPVAVACISGLAFLGSILAFLRVLRRLGSEVVPPT